jgi:hypothetical protein
MKIPLSIRRAWTLCGVFTAGSLVAGCATTPKAPPRERAMSAFVELNAHIEEAVPDPERREVLLGFSNQLRTMLIQAADEKKALGEQLIALNHNYDAGAEDFAAAYAAVEAAKELRQERLLAIHEETRSLLTPDEWRAVNPFKALALEAALNLNATAEALP